MTSQIYSKKKVTDGTERFKGGRVLLMLAAYLRSARTLTKQFQRLGRKG